MQTGQDMSRVYVAPNKYTESDRPKLGEGRNSKEVHIVRYGSVESIQMSVFS